MMYRHAAAVAAALFWACMPLTLAGGAAGAASPPYTTLQSAWDHLVLQPSLVHSSVSALAVNLTTGQTVAAIHPTERETPASVTKLFTSAAALQELGPNFHYVTTVEQGPGAEDSGPLYLVGGGDPWLGADGTAGLAQLAALTARRVHRATRVIGVASLWARPFRGVGWSLDDFSPSWGAVASPLMTDRSEVWIVATAGPAAGDPAAAVPWLNQDADLGGIPPVFHVENHAVTGPVGSADTLQVTALPGSSVIVVTGSIPASGGSTPTTVSTALAIQDPAQFAAQLFQQALSRDGVQFADPATTGLAPADGTVVARHVSAPLSQYIRTQNQFSVNQMAENLFRVLSVGPGAAPTAASSSALIQQFLQRSGVPTDRVQVDGSGVSPLDETSAQQVVDLLRYVAGEPWFTTYRDSLMHLNDPANCGFWCMSYALPPGAQIWVKTGNLANQWNYAGYAETANHDLMAFAILDDGTPTQDNSFHGSSVDQMMSDVALWPAVPPVSGPALGPSTVPPLVKAVMASAHMTLQPGAILSAAVVPVDAGTVAESFQGSLLVRAGLTPRLFLADAALPAGSTASLPPLTVVADGPRQGSTLDGPLVVEGNGDPTITDATLQDLAAGVAAAGIRRVTGGLRYAASVSGWSVSRWPGDMPWEEVGQAWAPPTGPLRVNGDQVTVEVTGGQPGQLARITGGQGLPLDLTNDVRSAASGSSAVSVLPALGREGLTLTGTVVTGRTLPVTMTPPNPGAVAITLFRQALAEAGVATGPLAGAVARAPTDAPVVAEVPGPSLAALAADSLNSDGAAPSEALWSHLSTDAQSRLTDETTGTVDQIQEWTGLAPENYVTADSLAHLAAAASRDGNWLGQALNDRLWVTSVPEQQALVGVVRTAGGQWTAVAVLESEELPTDGLFAAPTVAWAAYTP